MKSLIGLKKVGNTYEFFFKSFVIDGVDLTAGNEINDLKEGYKLYIRNISFEALESHDIVLNCPVRNLPYICMRECISKYMRAFSINSIDSSKKSQVLKFDFYISNLIRDITVEAFEREDAVDDLFLSNFNSHAHNVKEF